MLKENNFKTCLTCLERDALDSSTVINAFESRHLYNDATQRYSWARMSERGHSNASMVAQRIKELKPKTICLTHFGQRYSDYFPKDEVTGKSYVDPKFQNTIRNFLYTKVNDDDDLGGEEIISRNDIFVAYDEFSIEVKMDSQPVSDWYTNVVIGMDQKLDVKKEVATTMHQD